MISEPTTMKQRLAHPKVTLLEKLVAGCPIVAAIVVVLVR